MRRAATLSPSTLLGRSDGLVTAAAGTVGAAASGIRGWYARGGRAETTGDATRRDEGSGNKEGDALGAFQRKVDHRCVEKTLRLAAGAMDVATARICGKHAQHPDHHPRVWGRRSQEAERKLHELLKNAQEARFGEGDADRRSAWIWTGHRHVVYATPRAPLCQARRGEGQGGAEGGGSTEAGGGERGRGRGRGTQVGVARMQTVGVYARQVRNNKHGNCPPSSQRARAHEVRRLGAQGQVRGFLRSCASLAKTPTYLVPLVYRRRHGLIRHDPGGVLVRGHEPRERLRGQTYSAPLRQLRVSACLHAPARREVEP